MPLSKTEKRKMCSGCHSDYYNSNNEVGIKECWSLATAKVVKRFRIGWWRTPDSKDAFTEVKTLNCHSEPGSFAFMEKLPAHLR